ncbi:MAG: hypothetical protein ICV65_10195 [Flavisolibacter sp.]|nr:hypothetical protein [Flavisolibacter sp.]
MKRKLIRNIAFFIIILSISIGGLLVLLANRYVEPVLRDRLHTLIVRGSDSLYTYQLGSLNASFFGGNAEVQDLHIQIDSNRYAQMEAQHTLPALTMQLDLAKGQVKGVNIFSLLFRKKIHVSEIITQDANIRLLRHIRKEDTLNNALPLWKALQPAIMGIIINKIRLDGISLLYRNADTALSVKLQFDKCNALFKDIRIDSLAEKDTGRIAFTKEISLDFHDLKFRSPDSAYKLKAERISYSSRNKTLEVSDFKLQPTLKDKESFYKAVGMQKAMQVITFEKARFTNLHLDQYFHKNLVLADSVFLDKPTMDIYLDKTMPPAMESKFGKYPHQILLKANSKIRIKGAVINDANLTYTEKAEKTGQEGHLTLDSFNIRISNITNDEGQIKQNGICTAVLQGNLLTKSPITTFFTFYLNSMDGRFDASGNIKNVQADQLNALAVPLANTRLQSFNMQQLQFKVQGDGYSAAADVHMLYNNLFVVLQKKDEETGVTKTKKFLTKIVNRFTLQDNNPGPGGERVAQNVQWARTSNQSFFGLIWKTIFAGMQNIMLHSGQLD